MSPQLTATSELRALLRRVKLGRCSDTLPERLTLAHQHKLTHHEFLEALQADEVTRRDTQSAVLRAKTAGLDASMTLDRWDDTAKITYDRAVWNELCALRFVDTPNDVVVLGPVGVGKTFLATALSHIAAEPHRCSARAQRPLRTRRRHAETVEGHPARQQPRHRGPQTAAR